MIILTLFICFLLILISALDGGAVEHLTRLRLKGSDFQLIKVIGRGAYGEVQLVRHTTSRNVYAMKLLNKYKMVRSTEDINVITQLF